MDPLFLIRGLLEYRNTPIDDVGSPAQLLMSRRLRSIISTTNAQLQPKVLDPHKVKKKLRLKQEKQKNYFDQHAKHLPTLEKGDRIRIQMGSHWKPGVVTERAGTPRSYRIRTDEGREYRRNRRALMKSPESSSSATDISPQYESPTVTANKHSPSKKQLIKQSYLLKSPLQHLKSKRKFIHPRRKSQSLARQRVEELWDGLYVSRIMLCDWTHFCIWSLMKHYAPKIMLVAVFLTSWN